ncbi:MAG: hypothetical protein IJ043_04425 [Clostridia bacterium]|nr:hypothetical protein [Clostridia bacterium]
MEKWKKLLRVFYPPVWLMILLGVLSAAVLTAVFVSGRDSNPVAYTFFAISAYTLTAICFSLAKAIPGWHQAAKNKAYANQLSNRYLTDVHFKVQISLYLSLGINMLYAGTKLFAGIYSRSVWFITLAAYYFLLSLMRFLLLRTMGSKEEGLELKRCRLCGMILLVMNLALSGVVILVIRQNRGFEYPGMLIYVMASYTFYALVTSIINLVKYRRYNSPVLTASKIIKLVAALVSLLSLETAMLAQFGGEDPAFNRLMIGLTGGGVSLLVICAALYLIITSTKKMQGASYGK